MAAAYGSRRGLTAMLVGLIFAMLITMWALPPLIGFSRQANILTVPDSRKVHAAPMPQVGGVAIFLGFLLPSLVFLGEFPAFWGYIGGAVLVLLVGLYDDVRELSYQQKFLAQALAALLAVSLVDLGLQARFPEFLSGYAPLAGLCSFVFLIAVTNAVNLSDGLDGLAGGLVLISSMAVAVLSFQNEAPVPFGLMLPLIGGLFGFLRFNAHPARIFMGDCGAYFIGFTLGFAALLLAATTATLSLVAVIMVLGLPIYDTASVAVRRVLRGSHPFAPDRTHFHHRLLDLGLSHDQAVQIIYLVHTALVTGGFLLAGASEWLALLIYAVVLGCLEGLLWWLGQRWQRLERSVLSGGPASMLASDHRPRYLVLAAPLPAVFTQPIPSMDFAIVSLLCLAALLGQVIWQSRRGGDRATNWSSVDRASIYLIGAYSVYFLAGSGSSLSSYLEGVVFTVLALFVLLRAVRASQSRFQLTALDVLVLVVTVALSSLGEWRLDSYGVEIAKLIIWFYAVEALVIAGPCTAAARGLVMVAYAAIVLRYFG